MDRAGPEPEGSSQQEVMRPGLMGQSFTLALGTQPLSSALGSPTVSQAEPLVRPASLGVAGSHLKWLVCTSH